jgi:8-oxo-dGTP pyrophosphatase MutT (NUDIX family)
MEDLFFKLPAAKGLNRSGRVPSACYNTAMKPKLRVAGCFIEHDGTFLLLHRHLLKPLGGTWGLPAGKVESGESDLETIARETFEETGIRKEAGEFELLGVYVFDFSYLHLTFPTFRVRLHEKHTVKISPTEHQAYTWVTPEEGYVMPDLMDGLHDLFKMTGYVKS